VDLVLSDGESIPGRVVNSKSGAPVASAEVSLGVHRDHPWELQFTTADADGRFRLSGVPPGKCEITVHARRFAWQSVPAVAPSDGLVIRLEEQDG